MSKKIRVVKPRKVQTSKKTKAIKSKYVLIRKGTRAKEL